MQQDQSITSERAGLVATAERHDVVRWRCHTRRESLTIPDGFGPARLAELADIERAFHIAARGGADRIGGQTLGQIERDVLVEAGVEPELLEIDGNLLMYGGASCQWQTLIGNGTTTAAQSLTYFSNAQAAIGVGDTATAAAATQNDLTATTNKLRVAMDATYPLHTDGVVVGSASCVFRSTFATGQANYAWAEWGIFNSSTAATGRMLNRKVEALGTKTSASSWQLTLTLTLA